MSLKDRILKARTNTGLFCVIGGERLSGKTTLAGTLPGKALLLQADQLETGSLSAAALAEELENNLDVVSFNDYDDLMELLTGDDIMEYDNIYIDGISAINEMTHSSPEVTAILKKDVWKGYGIIGDSLRQFLLTSKKLTTTGKNVFVTLAYKPVNDAQGNLTGLKPDIKGQVTISEIQRLCPVVLAIRATYNEKGELIGRELLTKNTDVYPARVDSFLDHNNSGIMEANLTTFINALRGV